MILVVAAAMAGLFSAGPLSRAEAKDPGNFVAINYQRFARYLAPQSLRFILYPAAVSKGAVSIHIDQSLLDGLAIQDIQPGPQRMIASSDGATYEFAVAPDGKPVEIAFNAQPQVIGSLRGEAGLLGREPARLSLFIYP